MEINSEKGDDPWNSFWKISFLCIILRFRHILYVSYFLIKYMFCHISWILNFLAFLRGQLRMMHGLVEALLWINHSLHLQCYEPRALSIEALLLSPLCPLVLQSPRWAEGPEGAAPELSVLGRARLLTQLRKQESGWQKAFAFLMLVPTLFNLLLHFVCH